MMDKESLETYKFIKDNQKLFDEVQEKYGSAIDSTKDQYTILNYKKIFADICDYLEGYLNYNEKGEDKYGNKIISSTANFYDSIFTDKGKYRCIMTLSDMPDISEDYLAGTKELQDLLLKMNKYDDELKSMQILTNNEYRRISKVFSDDVNIWKWLIGYPHYTPSTELRQKFKDKSTPVMHEK